MFSVQKNNIFVGAYYKPGPAAADEDGFAVALRLINRPNR
jgi:hypothetical protein